MQNMPWLYTVEMDKNKNRSVARNLGFLFQYLDMNFSVVSFKSHKNFGHQDPLNGFFCVVFVSDAHLM